MCYARYAMLVIVYYKFIGIKLDLIFAAEFQFD